MNNRTIDMTSGSPSKHLLQFSVPLILTNMGQQLYMIVDGAIVGRGVGVHALAAVGATDWSYWLILWTIGGLTHGFSTFISRAFGLKDYREVNKSIAASIQFCTVLGIFLTVAGVLLAKPILSTLNTPSDILSDASVYLTVMILGTLIVMGYNMSVSVLRALGDGKTPLTAMVIAACTNIVLDCLFVLVFHWGIIGAAIASLVAQLISFLYCCRGILKIECIDLESHLCSFEFHRLRTMLAFGIPIGFQYVIITAGGMILQPAVNLQGSIFIGGYTATNKLYSFLQCFAMSLGQASCTFVSQNYGAGLYSRVRQGVADAVKIVLTIAVLIIGVTFLTRWQILRIFLDVREAGGMEALAVSVRYLTIMVLCFPILHILHIFRNVLQALGVSVWSLASGFAEFAARVFMSRIIIGWIGVDALFLSEPASWFGAMLCVTLPYFYYCNKMIKIESGEGQSDKRPALPVSFIIQFQGKFVHFIMMDY